LLLQGEVNSGNSAYLHNSSVATGFN